MHSSRSVLELPEGVEHIRPTASDQMQVIQEQLRESFPAPLVRKASKSIEQLVLLIMGLRYDTNLEAVVMRCISFLSAIMDDGIVLGLKDILFNMF
jgi:hypothetical protein